jgi:hypothetical protein
MQSVAAVHVYVIIITMIVFSANFFQPFSSKMIDSMPLKKNLGDNFYNLQNFLKDIHEQFKKIENHCLCCIEITLH